jgi:hypothetical protein
MNPRSFQTKNDSGVKAFFQNIVSTSSSATNVVTVNLQAINNYTYDLNGNLLSDGTRNFACDDENQFVSVWQTNNSRSDFVYDGNGEPVVYFTDEPATLPVRN